MNNILAELIITATAIIIGVAVNNLFPNKKDNQDSLDYYDYDYDDDDTSYTYDNYDNFEGNLASDYNYYYSDYEDYLYYYEWIPSYDEFIAYYRLYEQTYRDTCKISFNTFLFVVEYYLENISDMTFEEYMDYWY